VALALLATLGGFFWIRSRAYGPDPRSGVVAAPVAQVLPILIVVPQRGLWMDDFIPVRENLRSAGRGFKIAAPSAGAVQPASGPSNSRLDEPLVPDLVLGDEIHAQDYAAIVFVGKETDELVAHPDVRRLVEEFLLHDKVIGALCMGQKLLVDLDYLRGRAVASNPLLKDKGVYEGAGARLKEVDVLLDGPFLTGKLSPAAPAFTAALLEELRKRESDPRR
jgi:putative intracellular protease/amidase